MATRADAVNWLLSKEGGRLDFDGVFGNQCVDYFNFYYQWLTGRNPYSDGYGVPGAKDLWSVNTNLFDKVANNPGIPQPGDILIYNSKWGGGYGHVEMVISANASGVTVSAQNSKGQYVAKEFRSWGVVNNGLIGWLSFKGFNSTPSAGGYTNMTIPDQDNWFARMNKLMLQIRGRGLTREEFRKHFVGVEVFRMVEILSDDVEADNAQNAQTVGQLALKDNWQGQIYGLQARVKEVETALANEQAKPPKEVIKEVTKIVEKPVEVPKYINDEETRQNVSKILNMVTSIFDYFSGQYKTFSKYIRKDK